MDEVTKLLCEDVFDSVEELCEHLWTIHPPPHRMLDTAEELSRKAEALLKAATRA